MDKFKKILTFPIKVILIIPVLLYKYCISPLLPHTCRFYPSCSNYFIEAVNHFGPIKGSVIGFKRLLRCKPNGEYGYDPIPINLKGESKWLF